MVAMRRLFLSSIFWVAAACGPPGIEGPDAGDDGGDGSVERSGLEFRWSAPGLGAPLGDVVVDELRLRLRDIRAVGDATSGDETYLASAEIELTEGNEPRIVFSEAPPGRYSAFELQIARPSDGEDSWRLRGDCTLGGDTYQLDVEDEGPLAVSLPLDLPLAPGENRIVHVEVDLERIVQGIDWSQGQIEEDHLEVDDDSPLMDDLRANLLAAISIASIE